MEAEKAAIAELKSGQIDGLRYLVESYQAQAVQAATLIIRDGSVAEEIVQEAFMRVYERIYQFDPHYSFKPWFFRIVINLAIQVAKKRRRSVSLEEHEETIEIEMVDQLEVTSFRPEDYAEQQEIREQIQRALDQLTPIQRAIVVKRYFLDFSDQELANELDLVPGTIRWHLSIARRRLRWLLSFNR